MQPLQAAPHAVSTPASTLQSHFPPVLALFKTLSFKLYTFMQHYISVAQRFKIGNMLCAGGVFLYRFCLLTMCRLDQLGLVQQEPPRS